MIRKPILLLFLIFWTTITAIGQQQISLAGQWRFALDPDSLGYKDNWSQRKLEKVIQLPGTTDQAGYGTVTKGPDYGILTRAHKYYGPAWYQREINVPVSWKDKPVSLFLERVLWESKAYIDGKEVSVQDPLYVPHIHQLGVLSPGTHTLTICVNNELRYPIGNKGHGYTEYTQSIWNGVVGRIALQVQEPVAIRSVKTFTDIDHPGVELKATIVNANAPLAMEATIMLKEVSSGKLVKSIRQRVMLHTGTQVVSLDMKELRNIQFWDEFTPALYTLSLHLKHGMQEVSWSDKIGFRKITTNQHHVLVNGNVSYIRGNLDCVHFPLTGYPACDEASWERIFRLYKSYGLNNVRFHSWCPPEAAFNAADKVGIYIQAEIIWVDSWMSSPDTKRKIFPLGVGKDPDIDPFIQQEMQRILNTYGNHPSFAFFCIGNELGNTDFKVAQEWIQKAKTDDPRRLYAISTARTITPADDYQATHHIPEIGNTYGVSMNRTDAGLESNYSRATIPVFAHELGQFPVYPVWREINKYKGVLKARNLEQFRQTAIKNGIAGQDNDFRKASGGLQQLLYKNLIENLLLCPSSGGFHLLSMQDYQGQGEALVGWLDAFWDTKGITTPEQFRQHANAVVPLIRTSGFVFTNKDTIRLSLELANYYKSALRGPVQWEFRDKKGQIITSGSTPSRNFPQGMLTVADTLSVPGTAFPEKAGVYTFRMYLPGTTYANSWEFFIYPDQLQISTGNIWVTKAWDDQTDSVLKAGGKVLLLPVSSGGKNTSHEVRFAPLFWSASFFPGQNNETLGQLINEKSEAFKYFPTASFTNWQWYTLSEKACYYRLSGMPANFKPLVQPVSDFHFNEKLGAIFETKVGSGSLLVCGYDLTRTDVAPVRQLYYSLLEYMKSNVFKPDIELPRAALKMILQDVPVAKVTTPLPDEFKDAMLYIQAGSKAGKEEQPWSGDADAVLVNKGLEYQVSGARVVNKERGWIGKEMMLTIHPPQGIRGYLYVHFAGEHPGGNVIFEGREIKTNEVTTDGKWMKIFVMREDTNDGILKMTINTDSNKPLRIDQLIIIPD